MLNEISTAMSHRPQSSHKPVPRVAVLVDTSTDCLAHLDRANTLLADGSGFGSPDYMTFCFRRELKITPLKFRRAAQGSTTDFTDDTDAKYP